MTEMIQTRMMAAERSRRIGLFGAVLVGAALGSYLVAPAVIWLILMMLGLILTGYAAKLRQPGDGALIQRVCRGRTAGETVLGLIGLVVLTGAVVGSIFLPSPLWLALGLAGAALAIRFRRERSLLSF